jgi:hypothetical protein
MKPGMIYGRFGLGEDPTNGSIEVILALSTWIIAGERLRVRQLTRLPLMVKEAISR